MPEARGYPRLKGLAAEMDDLEVSTTSDRLVIWGAGGHARVVADIVNLTGRFSLCGFLDEIQPERRGTVFAGHPVLGGAEQLDRLAAEGVRHFAVAVGNCAARQRIANHLRERGFQLPALVHPRAVVAADVLLGDGSVVAAGAVINPGCRVGCDGIVNTLAGVDHDCCLEEGVHVAPGAHVAGGCSLGRGSFIGMGASIIEKIRVGRDTVVGAGAVVIRNLPDAVVAYGVPARIIREHRRGE